MYTNCIIYTGLHITLVLDIYSAARRNPEDVITFRNHDNDEMFLLDQAQCLLAVVEEEDGYMDTDNVGQTLDVEIPDVLHCFGGQTFPTIPTIPVCERRVM